MYAYNLSWCEEKIVILWTKGEWVDDQDWPGPAGKDWKINYLLINIANLVPNSATDITISLRAQTQVLNEPKRFGVFIKRPNRHLRFWETFEIAFL